MSPRIPVVLAAMVGPSDGAGTSLNHVITGVFSNVLHRGNSGTFQEIESEETRIGAPMTTSQVFLQRIRYSYDLEEHMYMMVRLTKLMPLGRSAPILVKNALRGEATLAADVFPTTRHTWIGRKLLEGQTARSELNNHIMHVYAWPLRVYFLGCSDRWLAEPDEIIHGFFADRLSRSGFLDDWERSGLRLRRWLMNAFGFYLAELRRARRRDSKVEPLVDDRQKITEVPERAIDRAFVQAIICEALRLAQKECSAVGLDEHWGIFIRRTSEGTSFASIASELGVSAARAAVMARTATRRFRSVLVELLGRDGTDPEDLNREIQSLLDVLGS